MKIRDDFKKRDGFIKTDDRSIYYCIYGDEGGTPLLTFHGGPGANHKTLLKLKRLAKDRPVIFYDQFCCGASTLNPDIKKDPLLWTMENFVSEIDILRNELKLDQVHLLGASFGTMLIADYLSTNPAGIKSIVFSSPIFGSQRWKDDSDRLRKKLPLDVQEILIKHEKAGTTDSKEYEDAMFKYYKMFVCRLDPWPDEMMKIFEELNKEIYLSMWGPSEFYPTGILKDYNNEEVLKSVTVPTLFTCGRFDEATPETVNYYKSFVPNAEMTIFEKSSHLAPFEEPERFIKIISDFLIKVDHLEP